MDAVPSYRHIPETGKVAQERLRRASVNKRQSGATSKIDLPHRTEVSPGYYNAFPRIGLYGLYLGLVCWLLYADPGLSVSSVFLGNYNVRHRQRSGRLDGVRRAQAGVIIAASASVFSTVDYHDSLEGR